MNDEGGALSLLGHVRRRVTVMNLKPDDAECYVVIVVGEATCFA